MSNRGTILLQDHDFLLRLLHDLKAPARHIRGFGDLSEGKLGELRDAVLQSVDERERARMTEGFDQLATFLNVISRSGTSLGLLLDSVSAVLRVDEYFASTEEVDLAGLANDSWAKVIDDAESEGQSPDGVSTETLSVSGTTDRPVQKEVWDVILYRVFDNCARYRSPERELRVRLEHHEKVIDGTRFLCVTISDNGSGMEPALLPKVTKPFERLVCDQESRPGLGMTMVEQLLQRLCGKLVLDSEPQVGTTVEILLPARG
ncbi:MAG: ATP-binding protein [Planctomycetota bacterium]